MKAVTAAWREAYVAAHVTRNWPGMLAVGDAAVRAGRVTGSADVFEPRARRAYRTALLRAHRQGARDGVLAAGEAFGRLGDRDAERLAKAEAAELAERRPRPTPAAAPAHCSSPPRPGRAAGGVAAAVLSSGAMNRDELPTPALLLDLDRFERNIQKMAAHVKAAGKKLRPHAKTHKCPEIARRQVAAGALGVCVAKVGEAEVMAAAGVRESPHHHRGGGAREDRPAHQRAPAAPETMVVVDHPDNVRELAGGREGRGARSTCWSTSTWAAAAPGASRGEPALALGRAVLAQPALHLRGLQGTPATART